MDTGTVSPNFEDIRPLNQDEVQAAIEELLASEEFRHALRYVKPDLDWDQLSTAMRACKTKEQFKSTLAYDAVMTVAKKTTFSLTISGRSRLPEGKPACTFISNHRDIVLDASFLNVMLYDVGYGMTQVAIGDNLLIRPWIKTFVRLNNSFIVKRGVSVRQMLEVSGTLSAYINHTIKDTKESIWIAQREGRAKDSNDRTQPSVLKMLCMAGGKDIIGNLKSLNIVPVAISYEFDPCDYLKAQEFQLKRDNPEYHKTQRDDLLNMETGILNNKGRVHFTISQLINDQLDQLDPNMDRNELFAAVASIIDKEIYRHYRFYPNNYVAYDLLSGTRRFSDHYGLKDKKAFEEYLQKQLDKIVIPNKDENFLRKKILEMYANPLKNFLALND
ncbi:1-acyl-sn-glycerol-3-phosphate acyltransferase [Parabacteroides sp. AGMB00274]|uniref:1-acyl-sn-glycerol-3-phosphate acyltransferase n=1 Tax=Parabacteroides faecalis TaxID=2924040 RepID=A0ABT0C390_9BACT|nr:1-acyl-sn-glycerol-3-phosphate acyltransferase [Parabacteroides faecalis]MCI7285551.1 1-acyl-sn-glycerol-3-phosphate acyltransferase [Parabacteroides sp.]MCJ2381076.1 1-acyl-sn-glycerol-3-phosphate acyltransferase [Parabacteroides faecalis]MDD6951864.1 1-acyl-sn-glycerol-3-phosphate acyltransferase [Parabacteroides sp.]MDY6255339.1 1-acyl-sn-glycerol-3-phosphate acyltransferase [Bacteroidales bacterium]